MKHESTSRRFQPGEGPSRGLLRDCENWLWNRWIVSQHYRLCVGHQTRHQTLMPRSRCQERAAGRAAGGVRAAAAGARKDAGRRGGRPRHLSPGAHSRAAGRQWGQADRRNRQVHRSHWALSSLSSYQHPYYRASMMIFVDLNPISV